MKKGICCLLAGLLALLAVSGCAVVSTSLGNGDYGSTCEHIYSIGTCLEPSKCHKCGELRADPGSHYYEDGVCAYCGEKDPDYEPPLLTDAEYERINSLMEGRYQFRLSSGNLVEYNFENGSFTCYTELGNSILENYGTYTLTEETLVLYYQNGTVKDCAWKLNEYGEIELFLMDLE